jgi:hypothetical protein
MRPGYVRKAARSLPRQVLVAIPARIALGCFQMRPEMTTRTQKTGPAGRFLRHLTRHTKTNGNKGNLLKTLSDEGDDSTLLCNNRGEAFPFAASPQSPGVAVAGAPSFGLKGGPFFRFCLRFCFSLSSRQSEATRDLSQLFAASEAIARAELPVERAGAIMNPLAMNSF